MMRFKICGLRDAHNALAASRAGADFLGFVFVEGVRRQLSPDQAREVIEEYRRQHGPGGPKLVGLFANQDVEFVNKVILQCELDLAQLCGDEPPEYWDRVNVPVIRQIRVREEGSRDEIVAKVESAVEQVLATGNMVQLDKHEDGSLGGTGKSFDWSIAAEVAASRDFLLAGGLTPDNVADAIRAVHPWGVDVSSGVETNGVKDPGRIASFAERVQQAGQTLL